MSEVTRAQDDGRTLRAYFDRILVCCPRCERRATVLHIGAADAAEERPFGTFRLQCESCTHRAEMAPNAYAILNAVGGKLVDPFFRAPLLLQIDTRLGTIFAYNEQHLEWLERFVSADLRERTHLEGRANASMASRLPRWMKLAKNRDTSLQAIGKLRAKSSA
jgi:hypothetical protein